MWVVVTVHVMVLMFSETSSLGTYFLSFAYIISKILPSNFLLNPDLVFSAHIYHWKNFDPGNKDLQAVT